MILNHQRRRIDRAALGVYVQRLRRALRLRRRKFNVCLVDDREMRRLNTAFRGARRTTDVLSFPWAPEKDAGRRAAEFSGFLGDVVISVEAARRNAKHEAHSTPNEIRWLVLHGLLHLLGHDHKTDSGEMTALELRLRERLGIEAPRRGKTKER